MLRDLSAVAGINATNIPVLVISADNDIYYGGGRSPIYDKRSLITNSKCEFMLMDKTDHNEHYSYFLTDDAIKYQKSNPAENIDKEGSSGVMVGENHPHSQYLC